MTQPKMNPAITDSKKRAQIEADLLALFRLNLQKPWALMDFEDIRLDDPTPEAANTLMILQSILSRHREYSLINFKGGVAVVRTADVESLNPDYQLVNEKANLIIKGGTDKSADLGGNTAAPINDETKGQ